MNQRSDNNYYLSIAKQDLAALDAARFDGPIIVVDTAEKADAALKELRGADIIGFDTETRPTFKKGAVNEVALVQLSTRKKCFLFRINILGLVPQLISLLEDEAITKVGLSVHDDFHNLHRLAEFEPRGFIDLQHFVKDFKISDNSLTRIYAILFGKRISKGQRLTNWEADTLSPAQKAYASLDATACVEIYDKLMSGTFNPADSRFIHYREEDNTESENK
ncbi:MAG: 3'-5' exonuclease domain-containing protein 2 [Muribaculaceae bacterium]|nr:3'-5' exonuclease domain-containing protein 2 [Muribaculaceae bacterium]MEE1022993.1 3'-5' exonuclease [Muribaculaceae bacterium]